MPRYVRDRSLEDALRVLGIAAGLDHLDYTRIRCVRSFGSRSRGIAARVHSGGRALWTGLGMRPHYVIEFVSEVFDNLTPEEKASVIIHELLHIPRAMGGGLVGHRARYFRDGVKRLLRGARRTSPGPL